MLLPLTASATPYCISYSLLYQLFLPTSHFGYYFQVLLLATRINYSFQVLLSVTCIYFPIRHSYQNSFVTNHYQLQYHILLRSSRSQRFFKIGALKNFAILSGKHLCWCLFNKVARLKACNFIKKKTPT